MHRVDEMDWNWIVVSGPSWVKPAILLAFGALLFMSVAAARKSIKEAGGGAAYLKKELTSQVRVRILLLSLVTELLVIITSGVGYLADKKDLYEYYSFAFPCAAGIIAGFGLLAPGEDGEAPLKNVATWWFFASALLIALGWIFYVLRHRSALVWLAAIVATFISFITFLLIEFFCKPREIRLRKDWLIILSVATGVFVVAVLISQVL